MATTEIHPRSEPSEPRHGLKGMWVGVGDMKALTSQERARIVESCEAFFTDGGDKVELYEKDVLVMTIRRGDRLPFQTVPDDS